MNLKIDRDLWQYLAAWFPIDPNDITSRIAGTFYVSRQEIAYIDAPDSPESERPAWLDGDESPEWGKLMNIALKLGLGASSPELVAEDAKTKEIVLEKSKTSIKQEEEGQQTNDNWFKGKLCQYMQYQN